MAEKSVFYALLATSAVSAPIYILVIAVLIRRRRTHPFKQSFFKLALSCASFDLSHQSLVWLFGRLPALGWFGLSSPLSPSLSRLYGLLWWYSSLGQKIGVSLAALNRLSVIIFQLVSPLLPTIRLQ